MDRGSPSKKEKTHSKGNSNNSNSNSNSSSNSGSRKHGSSGHRPTQMRHFSTKDSNILLVSDLNGNMNLLNSAARKANASYIICVGDFGFYDRQSVSADGEPMESQFWEYVRKENPLHLAVPVFVCYCDKGDPRVIAKLRTGDYTVQNLHLVDETSTQTIGNIRLLGLGGKLTTSRLFDAGTSTTAGISGNADYLWTNMIQIGQLVTLADQTYNKDEVRVFLTTQSHNRFMSLLAHRIQANVVISGSKGPTSIAYYPIAALPKEAMAQAVASDVERIRAVWNHVAPTVLEQASAAIKLLIEEGIKVLDYDFDTKFMFTALHIGVSSPYTAGRAVLVPRHGTVGFELQYEGEKRFSPRKLSRPSTTASTSSGPNPTTPTSKQQPSQSISSSSSSASSSHQHDTHNHSSHSQGKGGKKGGKVAPASGRDRSKGTTQRGGTNNDDSQSAQGESTADRGNERTGKGRRQNNHHKPGHASAPSSSNNAAANNPNNANPESTTSNSSSSNSHNHNQSDRSSKGAKGRDKDSSFLITPASSWSAAPAEDAVRALFASCPLKAVSIRRNSVKVTFPTPKDCLAGKAIIKEKTLLGSRLNLK